MDIKSLIVGQASGYPEPTGTKTITANGTGIDVKDYASADVNVPQPSGNINITGTSQVDVSAYATAQVVDADLVAGNIKKDVNILGVTGSLESGITPSGTISITTNGTTDVTNYASASVNVPTSAPTNYRIDTLETKQNGGQYLHVHLYGKNPQIINRCFGNATGLDGMYMVGSSILDTTEITVHDDTVTKLPQDFARRTSAYNYTLGEIIVNLPNTIDEISPGCFYNCKALKTFAFPTAVTRISNSAFYACEKLEVSNLPNGITSIESMAFYNCKKISISHIPSQCTTLGAQTFYNCTGITNIYFDGTPTTINVTTFATCANLTDIYVPWSEGDVSGAPWGATNATIHYDYTPTP